MTRYIILLIVLLLSSCSSFFTTDNMRDYLDSAAITSKVKAELIDKLGTRGLSIKVITFKNEVQLSGFVDGAVVKNRAQEVARHVIGVRRVINNIVIR